MGLLFILLVFKHHKSFLYFWYWCKPFKYARKDSSSCDLNLSLNHELIIQTLIDYLQDIVYSKWIEHERLRQHTDIADEGASLVTHSKPPKDPTLNLRIHNTFRLWITTQADPTRLIPGGSNRFHLCGSNPNKHRILYVTYIIHCAYWFWSISLLLKLKLHLNCLRIGLYS